MKSIFYALGLFMLLLTLSLSSDIQSKDQILKLLCLMFSSIVFGLLGIISALNDQISEMEKSIKEFCESETI